ncbi:ATP-dependent Clp protease adapter ClpS [Polynucleobacter kasalickyi]|uniref:ATP-dependent Clp protease adapter protein ClpS n=1 Tax=Polynucleobacter kasalickyi TaxID=1938817 RepID=A0A1W1YGT2_9BURK|nr:ATP-dependent Clp protease adapter ClpS [Polynucleobacter kasalickyi]SMC35397.1 ATP-dependent Clp protease adaptor protein ClpS [Polynucleobacter kasalickyi]
MNTKLSKKIIYAASPKRPFGDDQRSVVMDREAQKVEPPSLYRVVLLNDDFTPMEFVVMVIQEYFHKDQETATRIMLQVHMEGKGVCGVYTHDVAATKVDQVVEISRKSGHPLQCMMEEV